MEDFQSRGPVLLLLLVTLICTASANVANIARSLTAEYELLNHNPGGTYYASIILTNRGSTPLDATGGWSLYFCHENVVEFERFNITSGEYLLTRRGGFVLSHVKGCMYKFTPSPVGFQAIGTNQRRRITFLAAASISGIYDIYPNIYIADNTQSALITNTDSYRNYVAPFNNIFQYTRDAPTDPVLPVSPIRSYALLANQTYPILTPGDIIPTPLMKRADPNGSKVIIDSSWRLYTNIPRSIVRGLMNYSKSKLGINESPKQINESVIKFQIRNPPSFVENSDEWYTITVNATQKEVKIVGKTTTGLFNGFQTFLNLIKIKTTPGKNKVFEVPALVITDSPRFRYRGLLLDVASNFMPVPTIRKLLRIMALVKLNKLQLLLANDYAVRLEIAGMPAFHTVGSKRCHDESENSCLFSQLGSDPSGNGSGYYSIQDYIDILSLAKQLHIEIIPMWSFDSNMRASEVAMRAYSKATNDKTMDWSLPQLDKTSHFKPNLFRLGKVDPCAVETETFVRKIVSTIKSYHTAAGYPLKTFSVGGEDTDIAAWLDKCRLRNKDMSQKHPYVQQKLELTKMLANVSIQNGVTLNAYDNQFTAFPTICFNSSDCPDWLMPFNLRERYPANFDVSITHRDPRVMYQNRLWMKGQNATNITMFDRETKMKMFQRNGYKAIISMQDVLDFSVKEEPGPYVPGEMPFGRSPVPVQHVFSMWPESMCCSRYECFPPTNPSGYVNLPQYPPPLCLEDPRAPGPIGMQASISTRKVRSESELFQLLFPRLIAFAERAWHRASWEYTVRRPIRDIQAARIAEIRDFQKFKAILGSQLLPMLDSYGVLYYMTPPGVIMRNLTANVNDMNRAVSAKAEYPGFVPQIKTDKMSAFEDIVDNKVYNSIQTEFRTRNKQSTRHSRSEIVRTTFTDKYAREHMTIMHNLALNSLLEFPIQTRFRNKDDSTGVNSYTLRNELPLYFDKDFGRFFNKTGYQAFLRVKPALVQQAQQHMLMMQQRQRQLQNRQGASDPSTMNAAGPVPMGTNINRMNAAGPVPMGTNINGMNAAGPVPMRTNPSRMNAAVPMGINPNAMNRRQNTLG